MGKLANGVEMVSLDVEMMDKGMCKAGLLDDLITWISTNVGQKRMEITC